MTIAVDFDGTIVTHEYPKIGKPIPFAFATLKKLQEEHHRIILGRHAKANCSTRLWRSARKKGSSFTQSTATTLKNPTCNRCCARAN